MAEQPEPTQQPAPVGESTPPPQPPANPPDTEYRAGRPFIFTNVETLKVAIKKYFDEQDPHTENRLTKTGDNSKGEAMFGTVQVLTDQQHYTVTGLARALGVSRQTLNNYRKYEHYSDAIDEQTTQDLIGTIADAYQRVEEYNEQGLHVPGRANGIKFNLVNNFNWQDKTISETRPAAEDLDALDGEVDDRDKVAAAAAAELAATQPASEQTEPEQPNETPGPAPTE